ncbi:MAG: acyl-CoA thioesterase [Alphaproteobacteria bacterium]
MTRMTEGSKNRTPSIRMLAMPSDTNPSGDIFGGWLMSLMDLAGANKAYQRANGRVATIAVNKIEFHKPVAVGDLVTCFADITHVGRTSLTTKVEVFVGHDDVGSDFEKVTEGEFTYVALDMRGQKRLVDSTPK